MLIHSSGSAIYQAIDYTDNSLTKQILNNKVISSASLAVSTILISFWLSKVIFVNSLVALVVLAISGVVLLVLSYLMVLELKYRQYLSYHKKYYNYKTKTFFKQQRGNFLSLEWYVLKTYLDGKCCIQSNRSELQLNIVELHNKIIQQGS
ncbi:MAG: hypothetical protein CFH44_00624 [Proteobacteria bacterium]|nr:MAG: hypothetical protein CFH44_00624 [Pseudomonadota bacterium]|tara:strand:- start:479 stop:928 length:450 start_codon:yes stop_codon:yes gene_type:complete